MSRIERSQGPSHNEPIKEKPKSSAGKISPPVFPENPESLRGRVTLAKADARITKLAQKI